MSEVENNIPKETIDSTNVNDAEKLKQTAASTVVKEETKKTENGSNDQSGNNNDQQWEKAETLYEFTVKDIDGNDVSLSKYKGNVVLIVNVASNCGFTKSNYNELNQLYSKYETNGLRIAAFPCNQFAGQEPGCDVDIKEFANKNNVKFDMYSKIDVNGANAHPLYRWLKIKQKGIFGSLGIKWNFTKFLINKDGIPVKRYAPISSPNSFENEIKNLLGITGGNTGAKKEEPAATTTTKEEETTAAKPTEEQTKQEQKSE